MHLGLVTIVCAPPRPTSKDREMSLKDPNPVDSRKRKRVAIVIANPTTSTTTGWPAGQQNFSGTETAELVVAALGR
jgi:hypothetical protein